MFTPISFEDRQWPVLLFGATVVAAGALPPGVDVWAMADEDMRAAARRPLMREARMGFPPVGEVESMSNPVTTTKFRKSRRFHPSAAVVRGAAPAHPLAKRRNG